MILKAGTGNGKIKNGNKTELEMILLMGLGFKLGFVPIFHFSDSVPRACSPLSVSRFSYIRKFVLCDR